jgi:hypothetical protein
VYSLANKEDFLSRDHFERCPTWRFNEDSEGYYPVSVPEELPENIRDLRTFVRFLTVGGDCYDGYIVGAGKVFSVGIFFGENIFHFNKNMPSAMNQESLNNLLSATAYTNDAFFPVRYETRMNWQDSGYDNFYGDFDPFNK